MPVITIDGNPTEWSSQSANIIVTAKDQDTPIASMTLNGSEVSYTQNEDGSGTFTFTVEKNSDFEVTASDTAGNITTETIQVTKIDKDAPVVTATPADLWTDGVRNLSIVVTDELSGVNSITVKEDRLLDNEGNLTEAESRYDLMYQITANGDYVVKVKDIVGNENSVTVTEADAKRLKAVEVVTPPDKASYYFEENFDNTGMVVDAIYNDNSRNPDIKRYVILDGNSLRLKKENINLSYTENSDTVYTATPIKVTAKNISDYIIDIIRPTPTPPNLPEPESEEDSKTEESSEPDTGTDSNRENSEDSKEEVTVTHKDVDLVTASPKSEITFPVGKAVAGASLFFFFLYFFMTNVIIYNKDIEGRYQIIGKSRAKRIQKKRILVHISWLKLMRTETNTFKLVFAKRFVKRNPDCEIIDKIKDKKEIYQLKDGCREIIIN